MDVPKLNTIDDLKNVLTSIAARLNPDVNEEDFSRIRRKMFDDFSVFVGEKTVQKVTISTGKELNQLDPKELEAAALNTTKDDIQQYLEEFVTRYREDPQ